MLDLHRVAVGAQAARRLVLGQLWTKIRPGRAHAALLDAGLELLGKIRRDVEPVVARCLGVGDVRRDRLLTKGRRIEEFPRQLVVVGLENWIDHAARFSKGGASQV